MPDRQLASPVRFRLREWTICILLAMAAMQCVRSIFLVNQSLLDLPRYANGQEQTPFQSRVAMMPVLRWAHGSRPIQRAAAFFQNSVDKARLHAPPERVTPEKFICIFLGLLSIWAATAFCVWYGHRYLGALWWMVPALLLAILFATYGARYEAAYWYPYDLPHFTLFGIAAALLLEDRLPLAFLVFLLDLPMRETSIYLLPVLLALGYHRRRLRQAAVWAALMVALWVPFYLHVAHRFAGNPSDARIHGLYIFHTVVNPLHWPQVACAFAYLALPFCFGWPYLSADHRWCVYGALPCLAFTALFGIWYETRIWDEWMIPASILLARQAIPMLQNALSSIRQDAMLPADPR